MTIGDCCWKAVEPRTNKRARKLTMQFAKYLSALPFLETHTDKGYNNHSNFEEEQSQFVCIKNLLVGSGASGQKYDRGRVAHKFLDYFIASMSHQETKVKDAILQPINKHKSSRWPH